MSKKLMLLLIFISFLINIGLSSNESFINNTFVNETNTNFTNNSVIDVCFNISCERNHVCVEGECLLNISNSNVDINLIRELNSNNWVPVIVRLYDDSGISYVNNRYDNRVIYEQRANYFNQQENEILSLFSEEEFGLTSLHSGSNFF